MRVRRAVRVLTLIAMLVVAAISVLLGTAGMLDDGELYVITKPVQDPRVNFGAVVFQPDGGDDLPDPTKFTEG